MEESKLKRTRSSTSRIVRSSHIRAPSQTFRALEIRREDVAEEIETALENNNNKQQATTITELENTVTFLKTTLQAKDHDLQLAAELGQALVLEVEEKTSAKLEVETVLEEVSWKLSQSAAEVTALRSELDAVSHQYKDEVGLLRATVRDKERELVDLRVSAQDSLDRLRQSLATRNRLQHTTEREDAEETNSDKQQIEISSLETALNKQQQINTQQQQQNTVLLQLCSLVDFLHIRPPVSMQSVASMTGLSSRDLDALAARGDKAEERAAAVELAMVNLRSDMETMMVSSRQARPNRVPDTPRNFPITPRGTVPRTTSTAELTTDSNNNNSSDNNNNNNNISAPRLPQLTTKRSVVEVKGKMMSKLNLSLLSELEGQDDLPDTVRNEMNNQNNATARSSEQDSSSSSSSDNSNSDDNSSDDDIEQQEWRREVRLDAGFEFFAMLTTMLKAKDEWRLVARPFNTQDAFRQAIRDLVPFSEWDVFILEQLEGDVSGEVSEDSTEVSEEQEHHSLLSRITARLLA